MVEFPYLLSPDHRWMLVGIWSRREVLEQLVTSRGLVNRRQAARGSR
jgi:hypothetical protein